MPQLRVATFNLENFDETVPGDEPSLERRIELMRPQITRLRADVVCFQEVHGQERPGEPRALLALRELLVGTDLEDATLVSTRPAGDAVFDVRNLVVASRFAVLDATQYRNDLVAEPLYRRLTADPPDDEAVPIGVERPIQHVRLDIGDAASQRVLHVINVHLKSKNPTNVPGGRIDPFTWRTASAWAEGFFLSSMKRMSQALEVRWLVDRIFDDDPAAMIVVAGDFNAEPDDVPVQAIRGDVESTGNGALATRVLVPVARSIPEPARFTLLYRGRGEMIDHMLVSRSLLQHHRTSQIHNELLHDESVAFAVDDKFSESDHAPMVAEFVTP
ncbi:endonuclease/exonuclease/phosphatase family protein [Ilumatobacter sp.]|uniref:endonuclease/exonuclease/phosphatase family protein n=1 Tax=Ilumatobacter sp. TaxID=1967498 RepID=UPI003B528802